MTQWQPNTAIDQHADQQIILGRVARATSDRGACASGGAWKTQPARAWSVPSGQIQPQKTRPRQQRDDHQRQRPEHGGRQRRGPTARWPAAKRIEQEEQLQQRAGPLRRSASRRASSKPKNSSRNSVCDSRRAQVDAVARPRLLMKRPTPAGQRAVVHLAQAGLLALDDRGDIGGLLAQQLGAKASRATMSTPAATVVFTSTSSEVAARGSVGREDPHGVQHADPRLHEARHVGQAGGDGLVERSRVSRSRPCSSSCTS